MRKIRFNKAVTALIICAAVLAISAVSYLRLLDNQELLSLDLRFVARWPKIPVTDKVIMVEIGEDSVAKLGRFPFDRSYHALLAKALSEFGARMVAFDILFSEPSADDREMEEAMSGAGNVYLPFVFDLDPNYKKCSASVRGYLAKPLDGLQRAAKGLGYINIVPDPDGKFRRAPIRISYEGKLYPYLSFLMGCDFLGKDGRDMDIPVDENSMMMINFAGKWASSYKHCSYVDILQSYAAHISGEKPVLDPAMFKDKICLVGLTAAGTSDIHPTPFDSLYPGVGIHAEVLNSMLNNRYISRLSRPANLIVLAILCLIALLVTLKTRPVKGLFILAAVLAVFVVASFGLFSFLGLWNDLVLPILVTIFLYVAVTLYKYVGEWKKRLILENELDIARKIQESFLPKTMPDKKGVDIHAVMFTARQVGGDLFDFTEPGGSSLGVMIGDVSGKGVPASLFMAMVTGAFKSFAKPGRSPKDILSDLNGKLSRESSSNLFVTLFYIVFDISGSRAVYSNGGHLPALHLKKGGEVKFLDSSDGMPLGIMEGDYSEGRTTFAAGDTFVLYTDGVTEAMNSRREMYGSRRLADTVEKNRNATAKELALAVEKDIRRFEPKSEQHDDITIVVIKIG